MLARVLIIVVVNTAFLAAVLWWLPIEGILTARGYTPAQIATLQSAAEADQPAATRGGAMTPSATDGADAAGATEGQAQPAPIEEAASNGGDAAPTASASDAENGQTAPAPKEPPKLVATATINVRTGPGTNHSAIGEVTNGDIVIVLDNPGGEWVRIKRGDLRGWVYRPLFEPTGG